MAENNSCNHDCSSCAQNGNCSQQIVKAKLAAGARVKHVIGVVSGKGGVGKSFVSSYLAVELARKGYRVGILDADITGPSIPYAFGVKAKAYGTKEGLIYPALTPSLNIQVISSNMLLDNDTDPIIWRGPMIGEMVIQFYSQVIWEYVDYLLIDMPPGTGDVPLSIFQQVDMDGIIVATTPQSLVSMVVEKAANMAKMMDIPILGLVCNMAYVTCPKCGEKIYLYGEDHLDETTTKFGIPTISRVPFDKDIASYVDRGDIENLEKDYLSEIVKTLENMERKAD